jgi:hypothetical protein
MHCFAYGQGILLLYEKKSESEEFGLTHFEFLILEIILNLEAFLKEYQTTLLIQQYCIYGIGR